MPRRHSTERGSYYGPPLSIVGYALEINDPLPDLVRRADAGERIIETTDFPQTPEINEDHSEREKLEALVDIIFGTGAITDYADAIKSLRNLWMALLQNNLTLPVAMTGDADDEGFSQRPCVAVAARDQTGV